MTGHTYSYNNQCLLRDGKPWMPAMGEMHYSRCRAENWRRSIKLMKAGGIDIVASYTIWNHIEAENGKFNFTGNRDIKRFLDICSEEDMLVWLRIGPWIHGEVHNGGFPDWLLKETPNARTNDEVYMKYVRRFWENLYGQVKEHIGECVIGIQYENEYANPNPDCGDKHINTLVDLAKEIGFESVLRSATCCQGQFIGSCLPVFGGYPDMPWDSSIGKLPPNTNFVITRIRDSGQIVRTITDEERKQIWADPEGVPFMFAEMGAGVQATRHRRAIIQPHDVSAILNAKLASGVVLPGFYMYHGGTNPDYKLNEECVSELSYDFQAPIGEFDRPSSAYFTLRRTLVSLHDYGQLMAPMIAEIPEDNPENPNDLNNLRYGYRTDGKCGFLFVNNYVRGYEMKEHTRTFKVKADEKEITFPTMTFKDGDYGFYPYNIPMGKGRLLSTNANPLCILNGKTYVFFTDDKPVYNTEGDVSDIEIITLSREESLKASKVTVNGKDYLIISEAAYIQNKDELQFFITKDTSVKVYNNNDAKEYTLKCKNQPINVEVEELSENPLMKEFSVSVDSLPDEADEVLLKIDYDGYMAELFLNGKKVADQFNLENGWYVDLKRYGHSLKYMLRVFSLKDTDKVYMEIKPEFSYGTACRLKNISATAEYAVKFSELN